MIKREKGYRFFNFKTLIAISLILISLKFIYDNSGLQDKIDFQSSAVEDRRTGWESNRFGTALFIQEFIVSRDVNYGVGLFTNFNEVMNNLRVYGYNSEHAIGNGFS